MTVIKGDIFRLPLYLDYRNKKNKGKNKLRRGSNKELIGAARKRSDTLAV